MTISLKGLILGVVLFPIVWLAFLIVYGSRTASRTPGSSVDILSMFTHSVGPIFWLTLVAMLAIGCLIVTHWKR
jgi:hypothetical protein